MNNLLRHTVLALALSLPAFYASAQSTTSGDDIAFASTPASTVQATNTLALLTENKDTEATATTQAVKVAPATKSETTKTMSEELSGWVENKLAVVNSVKGSKRLK